MFGASREATKASELIQDAIDIKHKSLHDELMAMCWGDNKTQEEIDIEDAMAELDKEFPGNKEQI